MRPLRLLFKMVKIKKGKTLNPTDAYRKQQRKREIEKVRVPRTIVRVRRAPSLTSYNG